MRALLLAGDEAPQRVLAQRLAAVDGVELVGVVAQSKGEDTAQKLRLAWTRPRAFARRLGLRYIARDLNADVASALNARFEPATPWPDVEVTTVPDVNTQAVGDFVEARRPDVICVSGTAIVRDPVIGMMPPLGALNLHTGISPYYRGGPNCTLWCLARAEPWAIGSTIHVLDPGIDSGSLVLTDRVVADARSTAGSLVADAISLGHDLYVRVLESYRDHGKARPVPQGEIAEGVLFYTREWTVGRAVAARRYARSDAYRAWVRGGAVAPPDFRLVDRTGPPKRVG